MFNTDSGAPLLCLASGMDATVLGRPLHYPPIRLPHHCTHLASPESHVVLATLGLASVDELSGPHRRATFVCPLLLGLDLLALFQSLATYVGMVLRADLAEVAHCHPGGGERSPQRQNPSVLQMRAEMSKTEMIGRPVPAAHACSALSGGRRIVPNAQGRKKGANVHVEYDRLRSMDGRILLSLQQLFVKMFHLYSHARS